MELIRDNLIQNGISFPTKSFEKYEDCFFVSERLSSLSWFLFVNNVSGSTIGEGYALFPQQTYKQKIRSLVYAEYVDVGKDFAGMMLPRRRMDEVDSNFNFLSKSQARISPFGEQYSKVESAGNEFLDLVKKSQETVEEDEGFDSWDDFDVDTVEESEKAVESQEGIEVANLVEDKDGFLVDGDSLKADEDDSSGFEDDSNERDGWVSEDSEGDFDDWGSGGSEEDEDEFESWDDSDEGGSEDWGMGTSEVEDDADFDDWGSSGEEEDSGDWESPSEEGVDDFDDWGSSDEDDADFDDWGSSNDSEDLETDFEDDADFDDWGSDEEDEPEEDIEDDADFDDWEDTDEVEEDEDFDDWGSEEDKPKVTKGTPSKQVKRSPASELKAETEMMDFFQRGVNSLFRSTVSNGKKFGRRFASLPENEEK